MVRVAVLSDIHGNLPALEAVLAEVERENVDAIVCGGDIVGGPFPAEVLDRLLGLPDVRFVRGNVDRLVLEGVSEPGRDWGDWGAERARLGDAPLAAVAAWPLTVELEIEGLGRTLVCHAVPADDERVFTRITPDGDAVDLIGHVDADLMVCGHTHMQFDRELSTGLRVVNAGSVGVPFEGRGGAFWVLLGPNVEHRYTQYDVEEAVAALRAATTSLDDWMIGRLLDPPDPDEMAASFEAQRGA